LYKKLVEVSKSERRSIKEIVREAIEDLIWNEGMVEHPFLNLPVDFAFNIFNVSPFKSWSIRSAQVKEEITKLLRLLAQHKPKFILEIGTAGGGTLFLFARA
jgi:hypothetical protein